MIRKLIITLTLAITISLGFAQNLNVAKLDSLFQVLESKDKFMGSIAISENGKLLYTKAIGKADIASNIKAGVNTKYRIGSISKLFTSVLVFKAVEVNKLNLNQTIDNYFPSIENAKIITIGNLLNHRSGIHNFTNDEAYLTYNTQAKTQAQMIEIIANGKSDFKPDSTADYSNSNYVLLSYILEKVYKKTYKEILETTIIKPLGLKNTYVGSKINIQNNECYSYSFDAKWEKESETDMSVPMGAGGVVSNPTDLTTFIHNLFSFKLITEKSVAQLKTMKDGYGMGIFEIPFYDHKGLGHTGGIDGFVSVLSYFPDAQLSVALTSNGMIYENNNIMVAALSSYYGKPFSLPTFKSILLKTEDLDKYLGEYACPEFPMKITITKDNTKLIAQATGQSAFPLDAIDKDKFEFLRAGIKLDFNPSVNSMTLKQGGGVYTFIKK